MPAHLISGGARSGKSAYAEKLALESGLAIVYIATARAGDDEMRARIDRHRRRRPQSWRTVECEGSLGAALLRESQPGTWVIVDCLTLWLASLLPDLKRLEAERGALLNAIQAARGQVLIVTNELGCGVTPTGALTRAFVDEHGLTNQRVAEVCERLTLMVCGHPVAVKPAGPAHAQSR